MLGGDGHMDLFDYEDRVDAVIEQLRAAGHINVTGHGNSRCLMDSYNWSLMHVLEHSGGPVYDYVFIDGAHTWAHDALAFHLADRLLLPGGDSRLRRLPLVDARVAVDEPAGVPGHRSFLHAQAHRTRQVALVVDLLVRPDPGYEELIENKIFRKRER